MKKNVRQLDEMLLEDIEEHDSLLIWDDSEKTSKRIPIQTLLDYFQMLEGNYEK